MMQLQKIESVVMLTHLVKQLIIMEDYNAMQVFRLGVQTNQWITHFKIKIYIQFVNGSESLEEMPVPLLLILVYTVK